MYMPVGTLGHIISFPEGLSKGFGVQGAARSGLSGFYEWLRLSMKRERQVPTLWEDLVDCSTAGKAASKCFSVHSSATSRARRRER